MQFSVTFRHMEATDAIKEYAREKVERIRKYFPDPIIAHVVLSTERGYQHCADVNIQLAGIQVLCPLPDKLMMPDGFAALRRSIPINAREIIRVHLLYSWGLRPEKRNNLTWPVLLSVYSSTASCTR